MKRILGILFWAVAGLLIISLALTIIGSTVDNDLAMNIGIIAWLATSALFFFWLILFIWARTTKYKR